MVLGAPERVNIPFLISRYLISCLISRYFLSYHSLYLNRFISRLFLFVLCGVGGYAVVFYRLIAIHNHPQSVPKDLNGSYLDIYQNIGEYFWKSSFHFLKYEKLKRGGDFPLVNLQTKTPISESKFWGHDRDSASPTVLLHDTITFLCWQMSSISVEFNS